MIWAWSIFHSQNVANCNNIVYWTCMKWFCYSKIASIWTMRILFYRNMFAINMATLCNIYLNLPKSNHTNRVKKYKAYRKLHTVKRLELIWLRIQQQQRQKQHQLLFVCVYEELKQLKAKATKKSRKRIELFAWTTSNNFLALTWSYTICWFNLSIFFNWM